jgi:hypothetical protein
MERNVTDQEKSDWAHAADQAAVQGAVRQGDWHLQSVVAAFNSIGGTPVTVTLFVGGTLISGQLISGRAYFEHFASTFGEAVSRGGEGPLEHLRSQAKQLNQSAVETPGEGTPGSRWFDEAANPSFIHLKDPQISLPGGTPVRAGEIWRGKLAAVDGFFWGSSPG